MHFFRYFLLETVNLLPFVRKKRKTERETCKRERERKESGRGTAWLRSVCQVEIVPKSRPDKNVKWNNLKMQILFIKALKSNRKLCNQLKPPKVRQETPGVCVCLAEFVSLVWTTINGIAFWPQYGSFFHQPEKEIFLLHLIKLQR